MQINFSALKRGNKNFLIPSSDPSENKKLDFFEPDSFEFNLLVDSMAKHLTDSHEDFITKKA